MRPSPTSSNRIYTSTPEHHEARRPPYATTSHKERGDEVSHIERDRHINVPTCIAQRLPFHTTIAHLVLQRLLHGRQLENTAMIHELHTAHLRATREREAIARDINDLTHKRARIPSRQKRVRTKLADRIRALEASLGEDTLTSGLTLQVTCVRSCDMPVDASRRHPHEVHLDLLHIIGEKPLPTDDPLVPLRIRIRKGSLAFTFHVHGLLQALSSMHCEQTLPMFMQGLSRTYAGVFALMREHHRDFDLPDGTCYYTRRSSCGDRLSPTLLMRALGYHHRSATTARRLRLQIALLRQVRISGTHGAMSFEDEPLLIESTMTADASHLPDHVRAGTWSVLSIPCTLVKARRSHFVQVPASLLRCHGAWRVNLGLHLCTLSALNHDSPTRRMKLNLARLIHDTGLRQCFRPGQSRDRDLLARALAELEESGLVSHLHTESGERLEMEELPPPGSRLPSSSHEEMSGDTQDPSPEKRHPHRRRRHRHGRALYYRLVFITLYTRQLHTPDTSNLSSESS